MPLARTCVLTLILAATSVAPAAAATRYASPDGAADGLTCTSAAAACTLARALTTSQPDDTLSLAAGTYATDTLTLPARPLHWVATDPAAGRPLLTGATGGVPTINLPAGASGSSFDGLEIVSTAINVRALVVASTADAVVRGSVVRGRAGCIIQAVPSPGDRAGVVIVEDSTLSADQPRCVDLPPASVIRRSSIRTTGTDDGSSAAAKTYGLIVDSRVDGGLEVAGTGRVSRVTARGSRALWGRGVVNDTLAVSTGPWPGVSANAGGELVLINVTAASAQGPGVAALASVVPDNQTPGLNRILMTNSIARGTVDALAVGTDCQPGQRCSSGQVRLSTSNAATRSTQGAGAVITDAGGNQTDDPALSADFRLRPGSPAIDAGVVISDDALDLDGQPRVQGPTTDLGAFEATPVVPAPPSPVPLPASDSAPDAEPPVAPIVDLPPVPTRDATAPSLSRPMLAPHAFRRPARVATTLSVAVDEAATVTAVLQQRGRHGWRRHGRALVGRLTAPGTLRLRLRARSLPAGVYRFVVVAADAAGNRSAPRTATLRVLATR